MSLSLPTTRNVAALAFICLLLSGHGRRVKVSAANRSSSPYDTRNQESSTRHPLANFLMTSTPGAAFSTLGVVSHPVSNPTVWNHPKAWNHPKMLFQSEASEAPEKKEDNFFVDGVRSQQRVISILTVWAGLIAYVALGAPGKDAASQALDTELLNKLIANPFDPSVPAFFTCVFNFMGLWPAWYASVLLPGAAKQKPVPAAPFLLGSVAFGMFALSPYLALREYRSSGVTQTDLNVVSRWTEGKINAALLSLSAAALFAYGATANDGNLVLSATQYTDLFKNQLFVHVTSLDFLALWVFSYSVIAEDAKRRGLECPSPFFAAIPIIGHLAWLLLRPPLPED